MNDQLAITTGHRSPTAGHPTSPSAEPPTIFVVDDDLSFLESVGRLLRASGYQVRTFTAADDFLVQLSIGRPGCVLTDLQMPGMSGLELQMALAKRGNPLPVIFLTGQADIRSSVQAMRGGAQDFLTKLASKTELLAAITQALARDACERAARSRQQELRNRFEALSDREREVLDHVIQGKPNKQIADELAIHERTVKLHRTAITTKLNVHSVAELTRLCLEAGFVNDK